MEKNDQHASTNISEKLRKKYSRKEKRKHKILVLYVLPIIAYIWLKDKILLLYVLPIAYT